MLLVGELVGSSGRHARPTGARLAPYFCGFVAGQSVMASARRTRLPRLESAGEAARPSGWPAAGRSPARTRLHRAW